MKLPLQVVFRDVTRSDAVESAIRERAEKLDQFFDRIMSCRVTVGMVGKHKHRGRLFNIRVDLGVPDAEIVINRDRSEDVYVAVRDAFDHARRKLEDYARRHRGEMKMHEPESFGRVARLDAEEGFGFIEKADGSEFYFHRYNVVHPEFDQVSVGDEVSFLEEAGGDGPQANRVSVRRR